MSRPLGVLLGLGLLLAGCHGSGNQGYLAPPSDPAPAVARQAVANLPPGPQRLQIDGSLGASGSFTKAWRDVKVAGRAWRPR